MTNIKVCGITDIVQMVQFDKLMVDYAGLVFDPNSNQYVKGKINPEELNELSLDIKKTGIFADESLKQIMKTVELFELDLVQLNGRESPEFCKLLSKEIEVIKTFYIDGFDQDHIHEMINHYDDTCDYYSFDSKTRSNRMGLTKAFNWELLSQTSIEKPFFIGGGCLKPSDAPIIHHFKHPDFFGVDLNLFFESEPGIKDTGLVLSFIRAIHQVIN